MRTVDLRRDTITLPTDEMRERAFQAPLGDSVYGEDPVQNELEELAARRLGMEAALFVPSGTMGNLAALLGHTTPGDEIILEEHAHIRVSETGGAAFVGGLMIRTVPSVLVQGTPTGAPDPAAVRAALRSEDIHYPRTGLICLESPHHRHGGIVPPLSSFAEIRDIARERRIPVHLDGARIFNAAAFLGTDVREIAGYADSVMVALSKGLGAPVGSVLCGPRDFINRAARFRKMLGGGMRQTGWLCACGLVALSEGNARMLEQDNANARLLAERLAGLPGLEVSPERTHTNYVIARATGPLDAAEILDRLREQGVLAARTGGAIRFVTSRQVTREEVLYAARQVAEVCGR
ncbi:MAG: threonine aldolase family protein [Spirochaetota bacterium]